MGKFYQQMFATDVMNACCFFLFLFLWWQHRSHMALTFEVHGLFKSTHKWNFTIATSATEGRCLPDPVAWESALEQPAEATCGKRLDRLGLSGFLQSTLSESAEVLSPVQFSAFTVSLLTFFLKRATEAKLFGENVLLKVFTWPRPSLSVLDYHIGQRWLITLRWLRWKVVIVVPSPIQTAQRVLLAKLD